MTPERWRRIDDVYHAALAREAEERDALVAEACAGDEAMRREVVSLLAQNASLVGRLEGAAVGMAAQLVSLPADSVLIGHRLGGYQITAPLGKGGMGDRQQRHVSTGRQDDSAGARQSRPEDCDSWRDRGLPEEGLAR